MKIESFIWPKYRAYTKGGLEIFKSNISWNFKVFQKWNILSCISRYVEVDRVKRRMLIRPLKQFVVLRAAPVTKRWFTVQMSAVVLGPPADDVVRTPRKPPNQFTGVITVAARTLTACRSLAAVERERWRERRHDATCGACLSGRVWRETSGARRSLAVTWSESARHLTAGVTVPPSSVRASASVNKVRGGVEVDAVWMWITTHDEVCCRLAN